MRNGNQFFFQELIQGIQPIQYEKELAAKKLLINGDPHTNLLRIPEDNLVGVEICLDYFIYICNVSFLDRLRIY